MTPIRERKTQKKKWKGSVDVKTRSERRKEEKKKGLFLYHRDSAQNAK
jgi:hypothetical protein